MRASPPRRRDLTKLESPGPVLVYCLDIGNSKTIERATILQRFYVCRWWICTGMVSMRANEIHSAFLCISTNCNLAYQLQPSLLLVLIGRKTVECKLSFFFCLRPIKTLSNTALRHLDGKNNRLESPAADRWVRKGRGWGALASRLNRRMETAIRVCR